jgi:hypothetical protein
MLGKDINNQNYIHKEIRSRLNPGNACHCSVQNVLPSCWLSKNTNIKKLNIDFTLREEHRLEVFEKRGEKDEENCITTSVIICTVHQILLHDETKEDEMSGACSMHGRYETCIKRFSWYI